MDEISIFEYLPEEEREQYMSKKSNDWLWRFFDYPKEKNGLTVFSCFACGGGSTMGYKLAGCDVIGCVEIDKRMNDVYVKNHHPKFNYCMDLRDFNNIASTFPQDYEFGNQNVNYVCGMSVPPVMMKRIVTRLIDEGVFNYKGVKNAGA